MKPSKHAGAAIILTLTLVSASRLAGYPQSPPATPLLVAWSTPVNGLEARIGLKRSDVIGGTTIIIATLFLRNTIGIPSVVSRPIDHMKFQIVDATGKDVVNEVRPFSSVYDALSSPRLDIVLPNDSELSFPFSTSGAGIPRDRAGFMEFGPQYVFAFQSGDPALFLRAVLEIPRRDDERTDGSIYWSGRIALPDVKIPLKPE